MMFHSLREISLGSLSALPDELINAILLQLKEDDLARCSCTSRVLQILCYEDALWMHSYFRNHYGKIEYKVWRSPLS
jgi:hypothetical protein